MTASFLLACAGLVLMFGLVGRSQADGNGAEDVLRVHIVGLRNSNGKVHCTLFNSPQAFPEDDSKALKDTEAPIKDGSAWCNFQAIPAGKYAIVSYHDENDNGKFDENVIGMPEEGYAFSNNVKPTFSAPSFDECAFDYKGGQQWLTITMMY